MSLASGLLAGFGVGLSVSFAVAGLSVSFGAGPLGF